MEFEQQGYTRRQLADGLPVKLGRIDHIYTKVPPLDVAELSVMADTFGDLLKVWNRFGP